LATNDHTVPQMHLRRFARKEPGRGHMITAIPVEKPTNTFVTNVRNVAATKGFYWGLDAEGVPQHDWERLLGQLENVAAPVFDTLLNHPSYALPPERWPLRPDDRAKVAWWMAAQLLRTSRQRNWLISEVATAPPASRKATDFARNHQHLTFFVEHLGRLTASLFFRPWALVFTDACLPTSDVPVLVANAQDSPAPGLYTAICDVLMPLDPHRMLLLPNPGLVAEDPRKQTDHWVKFDGGLGIFVSNMLYSSADRHLFHHPDHAPLLDHTFDGPRLPTPWAPGTSGTEVSFSLSYGCLPSDYTVEAKWLKEHPPRSA
jgi:hypothetical protein